MLIDNLSVDEGIGGGIGITCVFLSLTLFFFFVCRIPDYFSFLISLCCFNATSARGHLPSLLIIFPQNALQRHQWNLPLTLKTVFCWRYYTLVSPTPAFNIWALNEIFWFLGIMFIRVLSKSYILSLFPGDLPGDPYLYKPTNLQ